MIEQQAKAEWKGGLKRGEGRVQAGSIEAPYSFASRFEGGEESTPEELIGAAHAGCFSMALSLMLGEEGHEPESIRTTATVALDPERLAIARIELETEGEVPGLDADGFRRIAEKAKENCPVSKALSAVPIDLKSVRLK